MIFLLNKAFNIIEEQLNTELSKRNFKLDKINNLSSTFSNGDVRYKIEYNETSKKFILSLSTSDGNYKNISVWLFDPQNDSEKEAKSIDRI